MVKLPKMAKAGIIEITNGSAAYLWLVSDMIRK